MKSQIAFRKYKMYCLPDINENLMNYGPFLTCTVLVFQISANFFIFLRTPDFSTELWLCIYCLGKEKTWNLSFFHCEIWLPSTRNLAPSEVLNIGYHLEDRISKFHPTAQIPLPTRGQLGPFPVFSYLSDCSQKGFCCQAYVPIWHEPAV